VARRRLFALLWLLAFLPAASHAASFMGLGILPGETGSFATGVSADGTVAVGTTGSLEAFR
jgi:hypothetical protein